MLHVDVIGSGHPDEFFEYLKAENYSITLYKTYSECHLNSDNPPAALAVHEQDVTLESTEAILKILKLKVVLLCFSPSLDLLRILKSAIKTCIDLPKIELETGVPLMVYELDGDRHHLIPGFIRFDSPPNVQSPSASESLQHAVKLIAQCRSHSSDAIAHHESSHTIFADTLVPPYGTCYFKDPSITITGSKTVDDVTYTISWPVRVYAYGTDSEPPNSTVYTILKYSGQFTVSAPWNHEAKDYHIGHYKVSDKNKNLQYYFHSPTGGTQQGATTIYNINVDQRVNLFSGATCTTKLDYRLTYDEQYTRTNWVTETTSTGADEHRVDLNEVLPLADRNVSETLAITTYPIRGIVEFRSSLTNARLGFEASVGPASGSQDLPLDLNFTKPGTN